MAEKKSFVYYFDWAEELLSMPADIRLKIDDAIKRYVLYGEEPTDPQVKYGMFGLIKKQLIRDSEKYEKKVIANRENGKLGGRPRKTQNNPKNPVGFPKADNDNVNAIDNADVNESPKDKSFRESVFSPPTLDDVKNEASAKGYTFNVEKFYHHYESIGWRSGTTPISDWRSKMAEWQSTEQKSSNNSTNSQTSSAIKVAEIIFRNGKPFVQQYGATLPLPIDYPPQPDVDYYWDGSWGCWRKA